MAYFVLLFLEIIVLFFLSKKISNALSKFLSINFLSFLFLPGVIIHELSHMLIAVILFVPVGDMEFAPKRNHGGLKLGSIEIAKTDPIRRSIIGFAPIFVGLILIIGIVYLFTSNLLFLKDKESYIFIASIAGVMYLLFAISNTMFSSKADMQGTIEILITLLIVFIAAYILGFRPEPSIIEKINTSQIIDLVQKSTLFLLAPIIIDLSILGIIRVFNRRWSEFYLQLKPNSLMQGAPVTIDITFIIKNENKTRRSPKMP